MRRVFALVSVLTVLVSVQGRAQDQFPNSTQSSFSLGPDSPSFAGTLAAGTPGDIWIPGPPPRRAIARAELGLPGPSAALPGGGVVDAFSAGFDFCGTDLVFFVYSVRRPGVGTGYPVTPEFASDGSAGDVFAVVARNGCPSLATTGRALLDTDAPLIVLTPFPASPPGIDQDEVSSLDEHFARQVRKVPVYFSVDAATAAVMTATSGTPVTSGDILVSWRRGDWRIAMSHATLGVAATTDVDAIAIAEAGPGVIGQIFFSVRGPLGAPSAGGLVPSTVYEPPAGGGGFPIVFLPPARMACAPTDDVDAMSILDPGQFSGTTCFLAIGPGPSTPAGALEEDVNGIPASTLWHPEGFCSWNGTYFSPTPSFPGSFPSIVGSPGAYLVFGNALDDPITAQSPLPGAFPFFGLSASGVQISLNGFVAFDQNLGGAYFANDPVQNSNPPNNYAAPWWDDLHTGSTGSVWAQPLPAGGFLVEWNSVEKYPSNGSGELATFQLELAESPVMGTVRFHYGNQAFGGDSWDATVGIEDAAGFLGVDASGQGNNTSSFPWGSFSRVDLVPTGTPVSSTGTWAMAYNQGDVGQYDYNTPTENEGSLVLPTAIPSGTKNLSLSFDYTKSTEAGGTTAFDQCFVEGRPTFPAGSPWQFLLPSSVATPIPGNSTCPNVTTVTESASAPGSVLASFLGNGGALRFRFDSIDAVGNNYGGWTIDNLCLSGGPVALFRPYGQGCVPGCPPNGGAYPRIGTSGPPISPSTISISLTGGPPSGAALLLLQFPPPLFSMPAPTPLSAFSLPSPSCCNFEVGLFPLPLMIGVPMAGGAASFPASIPPGFSGEALAQWVCIAPPLITMSDAGIFVIR